MAFLENGNGKHLAPETWSPLITEPVMKQSIAAQVATHLPVTGRMVHLPLISDDPQAAWVNEGDEINDSAPTSGEVTARPYKVAGLTTISNELKNDSEAALNIVGRGLSRDISRKVDQAFFGNFEEPAPAGLEGVEDVSRIDAGKAFNSLDPFIDAVSAAASRGTVLTSFVGHPDDVATISKLKREDGSNESLIEFPTPTPELGIVHKVIGLPLYQSSAVARGTIWGIPRGRVYFAQWTNGTEVAVDESAYFTADMTAVRAVMRIANLYPDPASIYKISLTV